MKEVQRFSIQRNGIKEIGFIDDENNFLTIADMASHLAMNVFRNMVDIESGEKCAEETNIELEISALNSLSNTVSAISSYAKRYQ